MYYSKSNILLLVVVVVVAVVEIFALLVVSSSGINVVVSGRISIIIISWLLESILYLHCSCYKHTGFKLYEFTKLKLSTFLFKKILYDSHNPDRITKVPHYFT